MKLSKEFINKELICPICNTRLVEDDRDSWKGKTTIWYECPNGCKTGSIIDIVKGDIELPIYVTQLVDDKEKILKVIF